MTRGDPPRTPSRCGDTPLVEAPLLAAALRAGTLRLKLETSNPTGVQKDRAAVRLVAEALRGGHPGLTVGTCGSLGVALTRVASLHPLRLVVFVPARYRAVDAGQMQGDRVEVRFVDGGYEDAVFESSRHARSSGLYDANPDGAGGRAALAAYRTIAREIHDRLDGWPDSIWVPVGNGTTLAGIGEGVLEIGADPGLPRLCGCGSRGNTAAVRSIETGAVVELDPRLMNETPVNEPLLNWRSFHAAEALAVVTRTGGLAHGATDAELEAMASLLAARESLPARPAACAGLVGLAWALSTGRLSPGHHLVVVTGR